MGDEPASDDHFLALVHLAQIAHHRDQVLVGQQLHHMVTVFLVAVDDMLHRPPQLHLLFHWQLPPFLFGLIVLLYPVWRIL